MPARATAPLRITIVTPAPKGSRGGNRATALRWAGLLRQLGHRVRIRTQWRNDPLDVLVAVHAVKSADAIASCRRDRPSARVVVLLAGTDIYAAHRDAAITAAAAADAIVALQPHAVEALPQPLRARTRTIVQSATAAAAPRRARFTAALLAHLRPVKQPLLAVSAVQALPPEVDVELLLAGAALDDAYGREVAAAVAATPRARWLGELSRRESKRLLASSHVCLVPSTAEGGANVVSEAIAAGTPVLCSAIPGNLGLLGDDWPAAFPAGDAAALAGLLTRVVRDGEFLDALCRRTHALQPMVAPARERDAWRALLEDLDANGA